VVHANHLGNLGSAAIWVSFDRLRRSGKLKTGDTLLVLGAEATKYIYGGFVYRH
jgi:3-oxoacyl-[acyl-carrier-protein] synthase-3